jgi:hypothetical protein
LGPRLTAFAARLRSFLSIVRKIAAALAAALARNFFLFVFVHGREATAARRRAFALRHVLSPFLNLRRDVGRMREECERGDGVPSRKQS